MERKSVRVVCIGAAVQDIFLRGKIFTGHKDGEDVVQEFELGSKNEVEELTYSTGGGATNAAVTFARQDIDSCYMGNVGEDIASKAVLEALHKEGVDTSLVKTTDKFGTGTSVILLSPKGERTVLTYRGASNHYDLAEADFHGMKPDWFYISSLSGDFEALKVIANYARENGVKIAINPGKGELQHNHNFRELLPAFNILSVNKEEMQTLFDNDPIDTAIKKAIEQVDYVLVTDGPNGSIACDKTKKYKAGMYQDVEVIDRIGAGDAFSSGFAAKIAQGESVEMALTFASANSTSVVTKIGAKTGILYSDAELHKMPIEVSDL